MTRGNENSPFADLRRALSEPAIDPNAGPNSGELIRVDLGRLRRTGIPEVVLAENKDVAAIVNALRRLAAADGRAIASRVPDQLVREIRFALERDLEVVEHPEARALVVSRPGSRPPKPGGRVGILSAGSSDVPVAMEAALMAEEMGACVLTGWDVGVAGLHRLIEPLERFHTSSVDVVVVAAGMDGALPSVVAGLVSVPVIGLPTSVGYGMGSGGVGALTTMLQSCAPGLVVVNIDNGIGAGATAALIANRAACNRESGPSQSVKE